MNELSTIDRQQLADLLRRLAAQVENPCEVVRNAVASVELEFDHFKGSRLPSPVGSKVSITMLLGRTGVTYG